MKHHLVYCYIKNEYFLVGTTQLHHFTDCELLFEFESDELRIAHKVLENLKLEKSIREQKAARIAA